jgi:hypothetical protein
MALERDLPEAKLLFSYKAYREDGQPRLSDLESYSGKSGWLRVSLLKAETAMGSRDSLVLAAVTDDGKVLAHDTVERLFQLPAVLGEVDSKYPSSQMTDIDRAALASAQASAEDENRKWLDEETIKLEAYAEDLERANDLRVKELDAEARTARKALRGNQSIPLTEKLAEERRIKRLEEERDDLKLSTFKTLREIRREVDGKLDEVAAKLAITPKVTPVMTIRWEIAA